MKRYIQEATDINIWTSLKEDTFGRNQDVKDFIDGLEQIEGNVYIGLDAKWGEGKTFFVRQVEEVLKYFYAKNTETEEKPLKDIKSYEYLNNSDMIKNTEIKHLYLPIYYNAWMYDNHNDPLMSLLLIMLRQCGGSYNTKINMESLKKQILTIAFSLLSPLSQLDLVQIGKDIQNGKADILMSVKTEEEIRRCVKDIFDEIIVERGEKLVIFVDELDRCNPSFAVAMLERIKHYFDDERIVFVVSLNKEQLVHTISNFYGEQFDATRYLNRFFDISIQLPELSKYQKRKIQCSNQGRYWISIIADELSDYFRLSIRERLIYYGRIEAVSRDTLSRLYGEGMLLSVFVPILILLDMIDMEEKNRFLEGKSLFLDNVMPNIKSYKKFVLRCFSKEEEKFEEAHEQLQDIYRYAFYDDNDEYYDRFDVSRDLKILCVKMANGRK